MMQPTKTHLAMVNLTVNAQSVSHCLVMALVHCQSVSERHDSDCSSKRRTTDNRQHRRHRSTCPLHSDRRDRPGGQVVDLGLGLSRVHSRCSKRSWSPQ